MKAKYEVQKVGKMTIEPGVPGHHWLVVNAETGDILGSHGTRVLARAHARALVEKDLPSSAHLDDNGSFP